MVNRLYNFAVLLISNTRWRINLISSFSSLTALIQLNFPLNSVTVETFPLVHFDSILVCLRQFTKETDDLVTIVAFFGLQWNLFTNHAWDIINKFFLKIIHLNRITAYLYLNLSWYKSTLTKHKFDLLFWRHEIVSLLFT